MGLPYNVPSVPWGFEEEFIRAGWRGVERAYGASTKLILAWIEQCGREQLYRRRAEQVRSTSAARAG